jgi:hypothetical protein
MASARQKELACEDLLALLDSCEGALAQVATRLEQEFAQRFGSGEVGAAAAAAQRIASRAPRRAAPPPPDPAAPCLATPAQVNPMALSQRIRRLEHDMPALKQQCQAVMSSKQVRFGGGASVCAGPHVPRSQRPWPAGIARRSAQAAGVQPRPAAQPERAQRVPAAGRPVSLRRVWPPADRARRPPQGPASG